MHIFERLVRAEVECWSRHGKEFETLVVSPDVHRQLESVLPADNSGERPPRLYFRGHRVQESSELPRGMPAFEFGDGARVYVDGFEERGR